MPVVGPPCQCTTPHPNFLIIAILLFVVAFTGCGGSQYAPTPSCSATAFDNQTNGGATESQLQALWQQAQQELATQPIALNPVTVQMQGGTLQIIAPDSRANGVQPNCIAVISIPDLTVAELQAENPGVALQHNTGWEFENIILARLGYDTSGR
jgi:hypothetical protein